MKYSLSTFRKPEILHSYINGNTKVTIYDDGTKIRETEDEDFYPVFPENIDVKITDSCEWGCPFCHENSTPNGNHGNVFHEFFDSLQAGTELAIGGGNIFNHPDIEIFLQSLKNKNIIANITVNQRDFSIKERFDNINRWINEKLIYGVGISWDGTDVEHIFNNISNKENVVLHTIAGIHDLSLLKNTKEKKILILGYKNIRRGLTYNLKNKILDKISIIKKDLPNIIENFKVVSFDNLALEQLDVKSFISEEDWNNYYMGDDGSHTMYIDLPNNQFASSSTSPIRYDLTFEKDIKNIFKTILNEIKR